MFDIGTRNFVQVRDAITRAAILFPGVIVSAVEHVMVDIPADETRGLPARRRPTQFAWVISLRTSREGNLFYDLSYENMRFSPLRDEPVVGLDFDEAGLPINIPALKQLHAKSLAAFQALRTAATTTATVAIDEA